MSGFDGLIGRDHATAVLRAHLDRAVASHGGLVLVTGEAGIGKTALVTEAAREARRAGALVLGGACWEAAGAPGFWPWVQVVRALRRALDGPRWQAAHEAAWAAGGRALAVLLGEAGGDHGDDGGHGPTVGGVAAEPERFQLYDAVTTLLVSASQHQPLVVVLEDLHWADPDSLRLLRFAAQHAWFERLLLVGTYREAEGAGGRAPNGGGAGDGLGDAGVDLETALAPKATMVSLTGLDVAGVAALLARTAGRDPGPELAAEVHRRTGGNPFFVEQTARLWHSRGHRREALAAVPPGVRDTVRRRLALLPPPVAALLAGAAALGREFHRGLLAAAEGMPPAEADRRLEQAVAAGLVVPLGAGRFAFTHDLVRETLQEDQWERDPAGARRRHAAVVRALDARPELADAASDGAVAAQLARHALRAGDELPPAEVHRLLLAAADEATGRMAFQESVAHLRRAYEVAAAVGVRERVRTGLRLAEECHVDTDGHRPGEEWRLFRRLAAEARGLGDPELLARVALSQYRTSQWASPDAPDAQHLSGELLREAAAALGLAVPPDASVNELARRLTVRSATLARRGTDDEALVFSLAARHDAVWGAGTAGEREALTAEMITVARRRGDHETEHFAMGLRWVALLELGDPRYLEQFREFVAVVDRLGVPRYEFSAAMDRCIVATLQGRFAEAEALQRRVARRAAEHHHERHFAYYGRHLRWAILLLQGRFGELARLHAEAGPAGGGRRAELIAGVTAAQRGDAATARRVYDHLTGLGASDEPFARPVRPLWLRFEALVAAASRDPVLCERARAHLAPFAAEGQWAVSMWGFDVSGPMALWLAVVDAAEGRWDEAVAGFTAAARSADALRARPWSVEARARLAAALAARGGAGDAEAAAALRAEAAAEAAELGMRHLAPTRGEEDPAGSAAADPAANEFRFDGTVWTLRYAGRTVHVPDAKGLRDLHQLLANPGTDIPATDLVGVPRRAGGDPVLDEEAKARYRAHLTRLDEEIDRATAVGADERAARLDEERAALLAELRAAAGLAGRTRRLGDEAERARKTVTARIRDSLRRLDARHPELAAHLRETVATGTHCAYRPPGPEATPRWRL